MVAASSLPLRVVLVGRTGLEQSLRRDAGIHLARARSLAEAIGELCEMTAPGVGDAAPSVVVIASDLAQTDHLPGFASALRKIDPTVHVATIGTRGSMSTYVDSVLANTATGHDLRALHASPEQAAPVIAAAPVAPPMSGVPSIRTAGPATDLQQGERAMQPWPVQPSPIQPSPIQPAPVQPPGLAAPTGATVAVPPALPTALPTGSPTAVAQRSSPLPPDMDIGPLRAILSGRDPIAPALDAISARLGMRCSFAPGEARSIADAAAGVRVTHGGKTLGWLKGAGIDRAKLEQESAWLAGWVALGAQQDQLRRAAFTDQLTGAWNRRYFQRFLSAAIDQARIARLPVSILYVDIDNFKMYNDRYGHAAGDEILVQTVKLLQSVIRPSDRVCRLGGDELAVIFFDPEGPRQPSVEGTPAPATPPTAIGQESIANIAARFQKQICAHRFPKLLNDAPGTLTISGGIATFPWDGADAESLVNRADELSIQSKRAGKNLITFGPGAEQICRIAPGAPPL